MKKSERILFEKIDNNVFYRLNKQSWVQMSFVTSISLMIYRRFSTFDICTLIFDVLLYLWIMKEIRISPAKDTDIGFRGYLVAKMKTRVHSLFLFSVSVIMVFRTMFGF